MSRIHEVKKGLLDLRWNLLIKLAEGCNLPASSVLWEKRMALEISNHTQTVCPSEFNLFCGLLQQLLKLKLHKTWHFQNKSGYCTQLLIWNTIQILYLLTGFLSPPNLSYLVHVFCICLYPIVFLWLFLKCLSVSVLLEQTPRDQTGSKLS